MLRDWKELLPVNIHISIYIWIYRVDSDFWKMLLLDINYQTFIIMCSRKFHHYI